MSNTKPVHSLIPHVTHMLFSLIKEAETSTSEHKVEEEHVAFAVAEAVFVGWFTFEYIIRYIAAPQKCR